MAKNARLSLILAISAGIILVLVLIAGGCTAADVLMNRDKLDHLDAKDRADRDTEMSKTQPPTINQTGPATGEGGGPQIMVFGDKVLAELSAMLKYFSSTAEERQTDLMQRTKSKLNLLGYGVALGLIVIVVGVAWRKTSKARKAVAAAAVKGAAMIDPLVTRIKALVARTQETTDPKEIARLNAEIVTLNGIKAKAEKVNA